jgi:hypothetical protein
LSPSLQSRMLTPTFRTWQRILILVSVTLNCERLVNFVETSSRKRRTGCKLGPWYLKSLEAWHRIEHPRPVAPNNFDAGDPARVTKNFQLCDIALVRITAPTH